MTAADVCTPRLTARDPRSWPWLLPVLPLAARALGRIYYRVWFAGQRPPARGPLLLVANHPNALFDSVFVAAAAGRPVRFLAKAPLFSDPLAGYLVRGAGAIPVYRRLDDPAQAHRNREMFAAVHEALVAGSAVAIFPEGRSHGESDLLPLRTGAARIALAASRALGAAVPIVPVGIELAHKQVFRSAAVVRLGPPIPWADVLAAGGDDAAAVPALLARIESGLRAVARRGGAVARQCVAAPAPAPAPPPVRPGLRLLHGASTLIAALACGVPYLLTRRLAAQRQPTREHAATDKLLVGLVVYASWSLVLAASAGVLVSRGGDPLAALVVAAGVMFGAPAVAFGALRCREVCPPPRSLPAAA